MTSQNYTAFGLTIRSEVPMTATPAPGHTSVDVSVRYGKMFDENRPSGAMQMVHCSKETVCIYWPKVGAFAVHAGREIVLDPDAGVSEETISDWLQSTAFAIALHQRGLFILHASAVVINGQAIAFAGDVGQGKSTTASAFHAAGYPMLTDDLVVIDTSGERPMVRPGFPHVKLLNETAEHFGVKVASLQALDGDGGKGLRRLESGFHNQPMPLGKICMLQDGPALSLSALAPQKALTNLMYHAFVARMTEFLNRTETATNHFHACTRIVQGGHVMTMSRPRDLSQLPQLVQFVCDRVTLKSKAA